MLISRLFIALLITYVVSACGFTGSGSGSGYEVYSDTGAFENTVDENGDPVPLMLTSSANGVATVTSASSGRSYTINTMDENGNPVGGVNIAFTEKDEEVETQTPAPTEEEFQTQNEELANLGIFLSDDTPEDFGQVVSSYSGKRVSVIATDPNGVYGTSISVSDAPATTSDARISGRDTGNINLTLSKKNSDAESTFTWKEAKVSDVSIFKTDNYDPFGDRYMMITLPALAFRNNLHNIDITFDTQGLVIGTVKNVLVFKNTTGTVLKIVEVPYNYELDDGVAGYKSLAADIFGGSPEDYDRAVMKIASYFKNGSLLLDRNTITYNVTEITSDGGNHENTQYPKDPVTAYPLNNVYRFADAYDGFYYLARLLGANNEGYSSFLINSSETNAEAYFGVKSDTEKFKVGQVYSFSYSNSIATEADENLILYVYNGRHFVKIDKPVMSIESPKLDVFPGSHTNYDNLLLSDNRKSVDARVFLVNGTYTSNTITGKDVVDGKITVDPQIINKGDDAITGSFTVSKLSNEFSISLFESDLSSGTEFSAEDGMLTITPGALSSDSQIFIRLRVTDGVFSDTGLHLISNANHSPTITGTPDTTVEADDTYTFTPVFADADSDPMTLTVENLPDWATFDEDTGTLTGTPTISDGGTASGIVIKVSDGLSTVALASFSITVTLPSVIISGAPAANASIGSAYTFTPTTMNNSGGTLTYTITNKPSWASFSTTTGVLTGTPVSGSQGTYSDITIGVSNSEGSATLATFSIVVPNSSPTISGTPVTSIAGGNPYSFTPTKTDSDGDTLTFSITNKPSWASFSTTTGTLSGNPTLANIGVSSGIVISVSDGRDSVSLATFSIAVINAPPEFDATPAPITTATIGVAYSYTPSASDANNDSLTFSITGKPSWASFDTATGALTGTPSSSGAYAGIEITVTDGTGSDSITFTITVTGVEAAQNFKILKTGQTTVYTVNDDGTYQKGTAKSLSRSGDSVTDAATGLMWQDSAIVATGTYTWADAGTYCDGLVLDTYSDWRLPTILELTTIINYGTSGNALESAFLNTSADYYWSSTVADNINVVFAYLMGMDLGDDTYTQKTNLNYARCVR